jgi:hypothetical protein
MSTYRDDLEAALARNSNLQHRVVELERALRAERQPVKPSQLVPKPRPRLPAPRPLPPAGSITYVAPATYAPAMRLFTTYAREEARRVFVRPRWTRPRLESDIVILDLLARACTLGWAPLRLTFAWLARVLRALWFVIAVAFVGLFTIPVSVLGAPLIAALSVRRMTGTTPPTPLTWGRAPDYETANMYALLVLAIAPMVTAFVPLLAYAW